jgi:transposase
MATCQGRRAEAVMAWVTSRPPAARDQGAVVVGERSKPSASALQPLFGAQGHGIDRCHGVPRAVDALDGVWRAVQKQRAPGEAKARKQRRKRWLQSANQRNVAALIARAAWRRRFPEWREVLDWGHNVRTWCERT